MLRLDPVPVETPASVAETVALLAQHGANAKICAGGTDVLPNMKHGLHEPKVLVHIGRVRELVGVREIDVAGDSTIVIGAMTSLHTVAHDPLVLAHAPGLARAAGLVAGPQLRRMGTLGGNIALDTRCLYYNQSHFWREALGFCLKKDGTVCHVVAGGKKCVAAASNDTATMLLALGASVVVRSASGERTLSLDDFFVADGIKNNVLTPADLLVSVRVPKQAQRREGYAKLRHRNSIDFPLLSVAVACVLDSDASASTIADVRVVVSALQARPNKIALDAFKGRKLDRACIDEIAVIAHQRCSPMTNIADDPAWRKDMVPVMVRRAFDDVTT